MHVFAWMGRYLPLAAGLWQNDASEYEGLFGTITGDHGRGTDRETENDKAGYLTVILRYPPRRKCSASWRHAFQTYTEN